MHRPKEHVMETESDRVFSSQVPSEWIYRKIDMDYGLDREIEIVENGKLTGKTLLVQLKSSLDVDSSKNNVAFSLETDKLQYYLRRDTPVLLVLVDLKTKSCFSLFVQEYVYEKLDTAKPLWRQQETIALEIPTENTWMNWIHRAKEIAFAGPIYLMIKKLSFTDTETMLRWKTNLDSIQVLEEFSKSLTIKQRILSVMLRGPSTPATIARQTDCTVQYARRILRRLEQDGFVELVDKKGTWKYYRLAKRGRSLTLSAYSSTTRDIHLEHGLYDSFDPDIVDVSDGSTKRYLTIRIAGQPPYLPLFPRFGFDSGALTLLGPLLVRSSSDGFPGSSEVRYTLGMTGSGFFDSLDEFTTYVELLRRHFWASDLCFTLDRSTGNELVLGWGTANLGEALRESKSWRTKFGVLLSTTTPHPVILIGDYEEQRLRFHLLVTSWYTPVSKELEELNRLFALAGAEISELVPNQIEEGPAGDEFHRWQQSFWEEERDREPRKCKISYYANRDRQSGVSAREPWYYWVVASNPMLSDSLDRYAVDDYVLKHVLDSQVMPLLPIRLNMPYKESELADVLSIRSLRLEYSILHQRPALPEHYGYYGPVIISPVVEHKIEA